MTALKFRELGSARGVCACCYADAELRVVESRQARTWRNRLDRSFVPHVQRTVSCSDCGATYPIRMSDPTPKAAANRAVTPPKSPRRSTDPATIGTGRDWRDTGLRV